jgi:hypothetical protein
MAWPCCTACACSLPRPGVCCRVCACACACACAPCYGVRFSPPCCSCVACDALLVGHATCSLPRSSVGTPCCSCRIPTKLQWSVHAGTHAHPDGWAHPCDCTVCWWLHCFASSGVTLHTSHISMMMCRSPSHVWHDVLRGLVMGASGVGASVPGGRGPQCECEKTVHAWMHTQRRCSARRSRVDPHPSRCRACFANPHPSRGCSCCCL